MPRQPSKTSSKRSAKPSRSHHLNAQAANAQAANAQAANAQAANAQAGGASLKATPDADASALLQLDAIERRRALSIIASCLLLLCLPYLWAWLLTPPGFEYGGLLYNPDDQNVHLSWARQAWEGHFFLRDLMTTENLQGIERPLFNNLFTSSVGAISLATRLPLVVVYHALRFVFSALALWWFYLLCRELTSDRRVRLTALALAAFGGGAGWLLPLFPNRILMDRPDLPSAPMMPEAFTFASALIFPLNIASVALLVLIFLLTARARHGNMWLALGAGIAAFTLSNIHTYDAIPLFAILLIWALSGRCMSTHAAQETAIGASETAMKRARWMAPLVVALCLLPPLAYQVWVFVNSSEFRIKGSTPTPAPPLFDVFLSYGPLMILAIFGAFVVWREARARVMIVWAMACLTFIYAPVSFARKMIEGLHLPLCFLAASGLVWLVSRIRLPDARRAAMQKLLIASAIGVMSVSSISFVAWCLGNAQDNNRSRVQVLMPPLSLSSGDMAALRWISQHTTGRDSAILCLPLLGNYAPRETGRNVFVGHWAETLNYRRKLGEVDRFFKGGMSAQGARDWLERNRVGYVVVGSYEKQFGATLPLPLKKIYEAGGTAVYEMPLGIPTLP